MDKIDLLSSGPFMLFNLLAVAWHFINWKIEYAKGRYKSSTFYVFMCLFHAVLVYAYLNRP